jgi:hypothetical protein
LGTTSNMGQQVFCGRCGAVLDAPWARCPNCGVAAAPANAYVRPKSRWAAAALSIVPGLGHVYLGEWRRGLFFLLACGGLEFLGFDLDLTIVGDALGIPMGLGGFGLWAFSVWDAYRIARDRERFSPRN